MTASGRDMNLSTVRKVRQQLLTQAHARNLATSSTPNAGALAENAVNAVNNVVDEFTHLDAATLVAAAVTSSAASTPAAAAATTSRNASTGGASSSAQPANSAVASNIAASTLSAASSSSSSSNNVNTTSATTTTPTTTPVAAATPAAEHEPKKGIVSRRFDTNVTWLALIFGLSGWIVVRRDWRNQRRSTETASEGAARIGGRERDQSERASYHRLTAWVAGIGGEGAATAARRGACAARTPTRRQVLTSASRRLHRQAVHHHRHRCCC
jgi:hypothetical protein